MLSQFPGVLGARMLDEDMKKKRRINVSKNSVSLPLTARGSSYVAIAALRRITSLLYSPNSSLTTSTRKYREYINNMFGLLLAPFFASQALALATSPVVARSNSIPVTSLEKNVTTTSGSGNVAVAGSLAPFGNIGIGKYPIFFLSACD
jgi:hypothetical protein